MSAALALAVVVLGGGGDKPSVPWERHWTVALKKAQAMQRPLMVDFWADWCDWCHRLDKTTYVDPQVVALSKHFIPVKIDTEGGPAQAKLAQKYQVGSLPTVLFLSPIGNPVLRVSTFLGPGQFPRTMLAAKEAARRVIAWEETLRRDRYNAEALAAFGVHLFEQDAYVDAKDLLSRARGLDKKRPLAERKLTRLLLGAMESTDGRFEESEEILKEALALPPSGEYDPKLLYVMGKLYASWGKPAHARAAFRDCLKEHPQHPIAGKVRDSLIALDKKKR